MKPWSTSIRHTGDYIVQVDHEPGVVTIKKLRPPTFWELVLSGGWADFKYDVIYDGDISELTYLANTASDLFNRNDRL
jgi:hypothetical protein